MKYTELPKIEGIVACSINRGIGLGGKMAWWCREEMDHFRQHTMGHILIMGHHTWSSIVGRSGKTASVRGLDGRINIVISSKAESVTDDLAGRWADGFQTQTRWERSLFHAILRAAQLKSLDEKKSKRIFIIGGLSVYEQVIEQDLIDIWHVSVMKPTIVNIIGEDMHIPHFKGTWFHEERKEFVGFTYNKLVRCLP